MKEMIESRIDDEFANEQRIKARKRRKRVKPREARVRLRIRLQRTRSVPTRSSW